MEAPIVQSGPGRKMGAICTLLNVRLIKTPKVPALIWRQPRQVLVLNLIGNAVLCIRNDNPLQYSCLENPMDKEAWWAPVHGVTKRPDHGTNTY